MINNKLSTCLFTKNGWVIFCKWSIDPVIANESIILSNAVTSAWISGYAEYVFNTVIFLTGFPL